jgi:carbon-monoxide dehydrogenase large subunit
VQVKAIFTHTHYTAPYRGAGRPEASCVVERLVEQAAAEMAIDPVDLRRRNTIPASAMPYKTGLIFTYDCGDFEKNMDMALTAADHAGFAARRKESEARGKLRGIGIANTVEQAAGRGPESAEIRFDPSGTVTLMTGTSNHGQGHDVTFKQILSEKLGLDPDVITFAEGDTDRAALGTGTFGSRSAALGGSAVLMASDKIIARGKRIAANLLEASEADIVFDDGAFTIAGTDRSLTITEIAQAAFSPGKLPPGLEPGFNEMAVYTPSVPNFPAGCHVCECEIDPETGTIELLRYVVVDDVGTVINPLLLKGQIMGGVAQGIGQAVMEDIVYDAETGQLLTASFMDYCMPRAADFCSFEVSSNPIPTKTNPIGAKGAGEAGCVGALPCALIAINNALNQAGVGYFEMPATPHRVWRAIEDAKATKTSRKPLPKGVPAPPGGRRRLG